MFLRPLLVTYWTNTILLSIQLNLPACGGNFERMYEILHHSEFNEPNMTKRRKNVTDFEDHCSSDIRCKCLVKHFYEEILIANCSHVNLTSVPKFHRDVMVVDLSHNRLHMFDNDGRIPTTVLSLDLSHNSLKSFKGRPFRNLTRLIDLNLSNNSLAYTKTTYPDDLFADLKNVRFFNLMRNNHAGSIGLQYPKAIESLTCLKALYLDGIEGRGFGLSLQNLESLSVSGLMGSCWIGHLTDTYFSGMLSLRRIDMSKCRIRSIDNGTFRSVPNLEILNLSWNNRLTFEVLPNLTYDLQFTSISSLLLNGIHCTHGVGTFLLEEDIWYLQNTSLQELHLDSNRLASMEEKCLTLLPKTLRFFSLSDNIFTIGRYMLYFGVLENVRYIDVSLQFHTHKISEESFVSCNDWRCPKKKNNDKENTLLNAVPIFPIPPHLEVFDGHGSTFRSELGEIFLPELNSLRMIDLHNNSFHSLTGPVHNLHNVTYLDLSFNLCDEISSFFLDSFPKLTILNISNNNLGNKLSHDKKGRIFKRLKKLKLLDLSDNRIEYLPPNIFRSLSSLQVLKLGHNLITYWCSQILHNTRLNLIDLSNNRLSVINSKARHNIDKISKNRNVTVDLEGNPLRCNCFQIWFIRWLDSRLGLFPNIKSYKCQWDNGTYVLLKHIRKIKAHLEKTCFNYTGIIVGVSVALVIFLSILLSGLVYRYRWKLRYLYYLARNRHHGYNRPPPGAVNQQFKYDAFISYSEEDSIFVRRHVLRYLEDDKGLRLCLHQRDFLPGSEIAANITNAIHNSRKTVTIITNNYLDSYWCMFEFNMARMESVYTRAEENVLFLVLYEKLSRRQIPLDVMGIIESDSYIEYPDDPQGYPVFWDRIYEAISPR